MKLIAHWVYDSKRVFILGPSHHVYLSGCAVSKCPKYSTPLGDLIIDRDGKVYPMITDCLFSILETNKLTFFFYYYYYFSQQRVDENGTIWVHVSGDG